MAARYPRSMLRSLCRVLVCALGMSGSLARAGGTEPDVSDVRGLVLISVDTLRADHTGPYGRAVATPNIDRLAREGVVVEHATTPIPTTEPAVASLLTGLYPWHHGVLRNALGPLPAESTTLAEIARGAGWRTAAVVGSFLVDASFGFDQGFEHFVFEPTQAYDGPWSPVKITGKKSRERAMFALGGDLTREAKLWLTDLASQRDPRFLLWLHYFDPHSPYRPPPRYALSSAVPVDLTGRSVPAADLATLGDLGSIIRAYRGEVRYIDAEVGRLMEWLRLIGLDEQTAIVFTADHGEGLGEHGVLMHSVNLFDELIHIPLIVRSPGLAPGRRVSGPAQLEDLFPTLLALMGLPVPTGIDGFNLLPWLRGEVDRSPRYASIGRLRTSAVDRTAPFYQQRWPAKWIGFLGGMGDGFALDRDPDEVHAQPNTPEPDFIRSHTREMVPEPTDDARHLTPELLEQLRALGYAP